MEGWIKIHKSILNWEWYKNTNTKVLFFHCLLRANWENQRFMGVEIPKGSFVSSRQHLAEETGLTIDEVRTALKHLISTNEITKQKHSNFTVFSVVNWEKYQCSSPTTSPTIPQPFPNDSPQYKNNKNIRNKDVYSAKPNVVKTNKFNNFDQRDFDYNELEKRLTNG